jgi:hypothetical protein
MRPSCAEAPSRGMFSVNVGKDDPVAERRDGAQDRQDWSEALWGLGLPGSVLLIVSLIALTYR